MSSDPKILLVGNYPHDGQVSMQSFAMKMREGLRAANFEVEFLQPFSKFGRLHPGARGLGKWLGYLDKFCIFPWVLRRKLSSLSATQSSLLVHICDHSNAVYVPIVARFAHLVTCHDLMAVRSALGEFPQNPVGFTGRVLQRAILRGLRRATWVVCDSGNTRNNLDALRKGGEDRSRVIHLGLNYDYQPLPGEDAKRVLRHRSLPFDGKLVLHVGNDSWYKNRDGVLRIFHKVAVQFPAGSMHLVFVGAPLSREQQEFVNSRGLGQSISQMKNLSCEELQALYSLADALLYPSFYEGFGWPPLEAQACGCPVIASTGGSLAEILESSALTAEADDESLMASHLETVLREEPLRQELREKGFQNVKRFSHERMIEEYLQTYREILSSHHPDLGNRPNLN